MYQVTWIVRNKVMLVKATGDVTDGELRSALSLKHAMLTDPTVAERVHCLFDYRQLKRLPLDPALRLKLNQSEEEHGGWTIHIQDNPLSRRLADFTTRLIAGRSVKTVTSIDEALAFLQTEDVSLSETQKAAV
ncbi:MAG: hypothetical protein AAFV93_19425 [Chloroflexota bacterium]